MTEHRGAAIIGRLLDNYERLRTDEEKGRAIEAPLPNLHPVVVSVFAGEPVEPGTSVNNGAWAIADSMEVTGWARRRSGVWWRIMENGKEVDASESGFDATDDGPPLFGEWVQDDDSESVHLRPESNKPGMLRYWTYRERSLDGGGVAENDFAALCQEVRAIWPYRQGEDKDDRKDEGDRKEPINRRIARYHVYWSGTAEDPHAIRRVLTRFVGFDVEKDVRLHAPPKKEKAAP